MLMIQLLSAWDYRLAAYLALQQMGNWQNQQMAMHYGQIGSSRAKDATLKAERKAPANQLRLVKMKTNRDFFCRLETIWFSSF